MAKPLPTTDAELQAFLAAEPDLDNPTYFTAVNRKGLDERGVTVIKLLEPEECEPTVAELREFIKALSPTIVYGDTDSYIAWPADAKGMQQAGGVGQLRALWKIRQDPRVVQAFSEAWGLAPDQLLTSMDTFAMIPAGLESQLKDTEEGERQLIDSWTHWDENNKRPHDRIHTLQGMLVLVDCSGPRDGGLLTYPMSHHVHQRYLASVAYDGVKDYFVIGSEQLRALRSDCRAFLPDDHPLKNSTEPVTLEPTRIAVPAGSLVLWNSRTAHRGVSPLSTPDQPSTKDRCVAYICMTPKKNLAATEDELAELVAKRRQWVKERKATVHAGIAAFDPNKRPELAGRTFGSAEHLLIRDESELSLLGRSLLGL
jgi:hypothetical protein